MSTLYKYSDKTAQQADVVTQDLDEIKQILSAKGIRFEQWQAQHPIDADCSDESILAAYADQIAKLKSEGGYQTSDVINMSPDHPQKNELRSKFLDEHTHSEDEVRFFVRGDGLFYLHIADKVFAVLCEAGDLISVPANTTHWFDMGDAPNFTAIRLFNNPEGWVANYTGNDIASSFPKYEDLVL